MFGKDMPAIDGYHFVVCDNFFTKLPYHPAFIFKEKTTTTIDLTKEVEVLFNQIDAKRRKLIRDGLKIGYQITHHKATMGLLQEFKRLYNQFIPRKGATPIVNLNYFKALMPYMTIFQGKYEDRILETEIVIHNGWMAKSFYKARDENIVDNKIRRHIGSVVQWEILMHFKRLGYQTFDFGALVEGHPSLQYYKLSFGGEVVPTYSYEAALTPTARLTLIIRRFIERRIRQFLLRNLAKGSDTNN
jgi:hypothetical protein